MRRRTDSRARVSRRATRRRTAVGDRLQRCTEEAGGARSRERRTTNDEAMRLLLAVCAPRSFCGLNRHIASLGCLVLDLFCDLVLDLFCDIRRVRGLGASWKEAVPGWGTVPAVAAPLLRASARGRSTRPRLRRRTFRRRVGGRGDAGRVPCRGSPRGAGPRPRCGRTSAGSAVRSLAGCLRLSCGARSTCTRSNSKRAHRRAPTRPTTASSTATTRQPERPTHTIRRCGGLARAVAPAAVLQPPP